jgi:tetratricopeptide (TPR) repeat protein
VEGDFPGKIARVTSNQESMSDPKTNKEQQEGDVESALLDADLFIKYKAPARAVKRLQTALERRPRSLELRERLREICASYKQPEEAARQCLALASLYLEREDFEAAHERLQEAKQLDPRINIASGLEAIRRARRPDLQRPDTPAASLAHPPSILSGDLSAISIFDAVQVLENSRLTGTLSIQGPTEQGRVLFNEGRIVGAEAAGLTGEDAFRKVVEATTGTFDFERAAQPFPVTINASSNTNLILDSLRQFDEENR